MVFDQFETVSCSSSPAAANLLYLPGAGYWFGQNRLANDRQYQRSRHVSTVSSPSCWIACVNISPYSCPTSPWRAACLNPVLPRVSTRCFRQHPSPTERVYSRKNGTIIKCENFSGIFQLIGKTYRPTSPFPMAIGHPRMSRSSLLALKNSALRSIFMGKLQAAVRVIAGLKWEGRRPRLGWWRYPSQSRWNLQRPAVEWRQVHADQDITPTDPLGRVSVTVVRFRFGCRSARSAFGPQSEL